MNTDTTTYDPPLPGDIQDRDEVLAAAQHDRAGTVGDVPADHTLVVAITRHIYRDVLANVDQLMLPGQQYYMRTERVAANASRGLVHVPESTTLDWWNAPRRILAAEPCTASPLVTAPRPGSLRIVSGCGYDPGAAAFRLHTALNEHTQHASAFVRWGDSNPHCSLRQYDGERDAALVRDAVHEADVIHNHVGYYLVNNTGMRWRSDQLLVRHYHGSRTSGTHLEPAFDRARGALLLGARLSLVAEAAALGLPMEWSPIPIPVARYRDLRDTVRAAAGWRPLEGAATPDRPLVIAHSPTNERIKGTDVLRRVVSDLQRAGVPVVVDYIRGVSLAESLQRKARADVCFDSFWLGIQGSGLEAGAMGMPVVAGDPDAAALYVDRIGRVPYTFANDAGALASVLERLAMDEEFRVLEATSTSEYVTDFHDYAAVARMYEDTISTALGRDVRTPADAAPIRVDVSFVPDDEPETAPPADAGALHITLTRDEIAYRMEGSEAAAALVAASPVVGPMIVDHVEANARKRRTEKKSTNHQAN